jgi:hypothetical protein
VGDNLGPLAFLQGLGRFESTEAGNASAKNGEGGDDRFEERPDTVGINRSHGATVGGDDARVVRGIENFRYVSVARDALSRGGVLRVWKTTQ